MKWFRMYHEARTDAKLRSLSDEQFRVWFNLLCFANEQPTRGKIESKSQRLLSVEVAKSNVGLLQETLDILSELEVVTCEDNTISFVHWDKRQFKSDGATERWHEWKDKQKTNVGQTLVDEKQTLDKQGTNVRQTFDQHVTDPDADTDTESDTQIKEEQELKLSRAMKILAECFPYGIASTAKHDILEYMNDVEDVDLLKVAYRIATEKKAKEKSSYVASVIRGFLNNGIKTVAQYEMNEAERQSMGGRTSVRQPSQRHSTETDDEWEAMERNFFNGGKTASL